MLSQGWGGHIAGSACHSHPNRSSPQRASHRSQAGLTAAGPRQPGARCVCPPATPPAVSHPP